MTLRVGLMFIKSREKHDISLEWGNNEAIDENGKRLGPCFRPAEVYLRKINNKPLQNLKDNLGYNLYWFDSENPNCLIHYEDLENYLKPRFPKINYGKNSPKTEVVTKTIKHLFKERFNIDFDSKGSGPKLESVIADSPQKSLEGSKTTKSSGSVADPERLKAIGKKGEELVKAYLQRQKDSGEILDYQWLSEKDPEATLDFTITDLENNIIKMDVKSTEGDFQEKIYISSGQIREFSESKKSKIYRVYGISSGFSKLRISKKIHDLAKKISNVSENQLPLSVKIEKISIEPKMKDFEDEIIL